MPSFVASSVSGMYLLDTHGLNIKCLNMLPSTINTNEVALLGFLVEGPRHGYAMYKELTNASDLWLVWRMKQGQFYALLTRLERLGMLSSFKSKEETGRPPRKMYRLTSAGMAAFEQWVTTPVARGRQFRLDLLVKLYFAQQQGTENIDALLNEQQKACSDWLEESDTAERKASQPYRRLVHQYRAGQIRAMLSWIESCRKELLASPSINPPVA